MPSRLLRRRKAALVGAVVLAVIALTAIFAPVLVPYDPLQVKPADALSPPTLRHPFGTDQYGRDILSRAIMGARLSLLTGLGAVAVALAAGVVVGLACGVIGGWTDLLVMRLVDIMMAFPGTLMALVVVAVLGQGTVNVMLARLLRRRKTALVGAIVLAVIGLAALFAPALVPYDPLQVKPAEALSPPTLRHPFGTDQYGRDILSRAIMGARLSLLTGLGAVAVALAAGVAVGLACGVIGGWTDLLVMRLIDIMMAFPGTLMALVVVAVLGQGTVNVMLAVGVSLVPTFVRLVRGDVLSVRENVYVEAARALGCWPTRVAVQHVLPNVVAPIIVLSTVAIAWSIILGASLSFLGLGPRPPIPEWGIDLSNGRNYLLRAWWIASVPGCCIMLTVVAVNLVGDALRDELDPRLRSLANL